MKDEFSYPTGRADLVVAARTPRGDVRDAVKAWRLAAFDHAHTSYFGMSHVRDMRAYWLGVLRLQREREWGFHTFHYRAPN
jgi:hypothetical protein